MPKHTLTAAALAALLATPAFAQSMPPAAGSPTAQMNQEMNQKPSSNMAPEMQKHAGFIQHQSAGDWRASKLIGTNVYGPDDKSIGEINDVILASDGSVKAAVVGVGGFLGVGEKNVAVPFDTLNVRRKSNSSAIDKITVSFGKDELKNAPKFAYYDASKSATTGAGTGMKPLNAGPMTDHTKPTK
jgi:sporulation protein YlmC with PRC-barrel domain